VKYTGIALMDGTQFLLGDPIPESPRNEGLVLREIKVVGQDYPVALTFTGSEETVSGSSLLLVPARAVKWLMSEV